MGHPRNGDAALVELRRSIDNIDGALLPLLAERFRLTEKIGCVKAELEVPAKDATRESLQVSRFRDLATRHGLDPEVAVDIMERIIRHACVRHEELRRGCGGGVELLEAFFRQAASRPEKPFVVEGSKELSYGDAGRAVSQMAKVLQGQDVEIIVRSENSTRFVLLLVACILARRSVNIFSEGDDSEPVYKQLLLRPHALYDGEAMARLQRDQVAAVAVEGEGERRFSPGPFVAFPSSGTTGHKKLLRYSLDTLGRRTRLFAQFYGLDEGDRFFCTSSLAHAHGLMVHFLPALTLGATLGLLDLQKMSVGRIAAMQARLRATVFSALPTIYSLLLRYEVALEFGDLKLLLCGSERLESAAKADFESRYGVKITDQFGCAETGPLYVLEHRQDGRFLTTVLPGKTIDLVETEVPGLRRLCVQSSVMVDEMVTAGGAVSSPKSLVLNDLAHDDGVNGLRLLGREEAIIKRAGSVTSLEDIEAALEGRHRGTSFLALKDDSDGYELLYEGPGELTAEDVALDFAVPPCTLTRVSTIPRSAAGKKLRRRIRRADLSGIPQVS